MKEFTETEKGILKILSDGRRHSKSEIHSCLPDELGDINNIRIHIFRIRKKMKGSGQEIVCVIRNRTTHYQHVRLLRDD